MKLLPNVTPYATLNIHRSRAGWLCYWAEVGDDRLLLHSPLSAFPYQPLRWMVTVELAWKEKYGVQDLQR